MNRTTTLQAKGQVTLPLQARRELGVKPGDPLVWVRNDAGHWEIWRAEDIAERMSASFDAFSAWAKKARQAYGPKTK